MHVISQVLFLKNPLLSGTFHYFYLFQEPSKYRMHTSGIESDRQMLNTINKMVSTDYRTCLCDSSVLNI